MATQKFIILVEEKEKKERAELDIFKEVKERAAAVWNWVKTNKEDLIWASGAVVGIVAGVKKLTTGRVYDEERYRVAHTYYDRQTGYHWQLRRPMTNSEMTELLMRRRAGEDTSDILYDLGLLR